MSVNGITSTAATYASYAASEKSTKEESASKTTAKNDAGVVYESTSKTQKKSNTAIVSKLKADAEAHTAQLQNIVSQLISKQGSAFGTANDMWRFLAGGNFSVDAETKAQAQADIAEDGYWGVKATSDRILDFAKAICNNDPKMIDKMRNAFKKGFDQATKTWGGKLPEISQKTYTAVMEKFDAWANENQAKETANAES